MKIALSVTVDADLAPFLQETNPSQLINRLLTEHFRQNDTDFEAEIRQKRREISQKKALLAQKTALLAQKKLNYEVKMRQLQRDQRRGAILEPDALEELKNWESNQKGEKEDV